MPDYEETLTSFYESWKDYMDTVKRAAAPLAREQLALRAAPNERTVGMHGLDAPRP